MFQTLGVVGERWTVLTSPKTFGKVGAETLGCAGEVGFMVGGGGYRRRR